MAECTVAPVAMEDSDREADSASDEQDSMPASPEPRPYEVQKHFPKEDSEDSELEHIMGHHPPREGHPFAHHGHHKADSEGEGHSRPQTPGTPTFLRPAAVPRGPGELEHESRHGAQRGHVDFSLPSPISPSRPKSPWGRYDPYDSTELSSFILSQCLAPLVCLPERNSHNVCQLLDQDKEYVGFATLPNQVHRKSVKKGFDFTLMVAGESGLGKSTLVNSLFLTDLYKDRKLLNAEGEAHLHLLSAFAAITHTCLYCLSDGCVVLVERITQTVEITKHTVDIEEKGVKLKLTIVDTPGFGDAVNNTECWKSVADYIDQQFEQYFRDESGLNRKNIQDNRVHCCLYFISPFGHGLRPLDVEFMKALHEKVNIVPVLAKADTLTPTEIREEIEQYGIKIYQFPDCDSDEDEDFKQQDQELKDSIPFAVIGSNTVVEAKGKRVRGRLYPWGIVEVENPAHCDFVKLRNMLVRTHMQDLKDVTRETHYENYRAQCIQSMTRMVVKERNRNTSSVLLALQFETVIVTLVKLTVRACMCCFAPSSKLTRESGTDFPIPMVPGVTDNETEKLIREKDEEVRHYPCQGPHEQTQHHDQHSDPEPLAETEPDADPHSQGS
ncbi:Septin-4 [Labeo rohita]|uniref:Septin-4 n=1 Tax=Labeo rohita TaxID=84645 RepID=A0ABQ8LAJ0_LABRO|nr:Septin-4 [Labeo rohita]